MYKILKHYLIGLSVVLCAWSMIALLAPTTYAADEETPTCTHQYALCIAASCDEKGECGGNCDQAGVKDGSCGACYVFPPGDSTYAVGASVRPDLTTCDELAPTAETSNTNATVSSTYSSILVDTYEFVPQDFSDCSGSINTADCMGAVCTLNPESDDIELLEKSNDGQTYFIPTATCKCKPMTLPVHEAGIYQRLKKASGVYACNTVWSTSG